VTNKWLSLSLIIFEVCGFNFDCSPSFVPS
jgi:hypothetical protein